MSYKHYKYVVLILIIVMGIALGSVTWVANDSGPTEGAVAERPQVCMAKFSFETAKTPEEITWGLMQRTSLPEDHGMLFVFPEAKRQSFWMFNTLIDLSVAYLDQDRVIMEIHELKAHPEKMDPARPVRSVSDMSQYPLWDPVVLFFHQEGIPSEEPVSYALEMPAHWFEDHGIRVGDQCQWAGDDGCVMRTL